MTGGHLRIAIPSEGYPDQSRLASDLLSLLHRNSNALNPESTKESDKSAAVVLSHVKIGNQGYCLIRYPIEAIDSLTEHQKMIARLVIEGYSNREIAKKLGKSHYTIAVTISRIFRKMNLGSRHEITCCGILFNEFPLMAEEPI